VARRRKATAGARLGSRDPTSLSERADVVIVCLSNRSEKRGYVQKEIRRALDVADEQAEGAIYLIPVKLTECSIPDRLSKWQCVDLSIANGETKLEAALRQCAAEREGQRRLVGG